MCLSKIDACEKVEKTMFFFDVGETSHSMSLEESKRAQLSSLLGAFD